MKLTRTYHYESDYSLDVARQKLEEYFKSTMRDYTRRYQLSGLFISSTAFEFRYKGQLTFFRPPYKSTPPVSGKLVQPGQGRLQVTLTFRLLLRWTAISVVAWVLIPYIIFFITGIDKVPLKIFFLLILFQAGAVSFILYRTSRYGKKSIEQLLHLRELKFQ